MKLEGRDVLVTGANGFVGSHLTEKLVEEGANVKAFVRATSSGSLQNLRSVYDDVDLIRGDLRDQHSARQAIKSVSSHGDGIVFHLAAQAHVGESWDRPYETVDTNVMGTLNLLQALIDLDADIHKFDTAGTSEQYGNKDGSKENSYNEDGEGLILNEGSPINPKSIYATSKVAADFLTMNYNDAYGLPTVTTRMFNNYGPRQNPRYITGTVISQALKRDKVELGNLTPKRDMCYVSDGVRGHMDVAMEGKPGEVYTYGYGENITMRDWCEKILSIGAKQGHWSSDVGIVQDEERYRPGDSDVKELRVGYSKINDLTGWEPKVSWKEGIRRTVSWYAQNEKKWIDKVDWR